MLGRAGPERDESSDLKDRKRQNGPGDASDIGVVRVFYNPGPDAEDRLRRLFALMVKHATGDGRPESGVDSPPVEPQAADHVGEEA